MKKIASDLIDLEIGHVLSLEEEGAATILTELPAKQLFLDMDDTTAFTFEINNKHFTLLNTGSGSIAIRTV